MKVFRAEQVREIDSYTIDNEPIASIDLMERAASRLCGWYVRHYHIDRRVMIFAGPGNNGGDALALARMLAERQYRVECFLLKFSKSTKDSLINREGLEEQGLAKVVDVGEGDELPGIKESDVVVDGIFGSGLTRRASGFPAQVIRHINQESSATIAIDIPSGLFGEDNRENDPESIIRADVCLTFQFPFLSFFFAENAPYVGKWRVQDIRLHPDAIKTTPCDYRTIEDSQVSSLLPERHQFAHKGSFGHALLISGCYGMMGAALLAGEACLRSGAGLLTLHVPRFGYQVVQTALPEALVSMDQSDILFSEAPELDSFSAIGIGPGLGCKPNSVKGLKMLLDNARVPLVIDADALNIISKNKDWLNLLPGNTILTPHPKEFDRLAGESTTAYGRHMKQREFAREYKVIVVLKGAHTGIASPDGSYFFNTTGNPGMATGGSGDVLTGLITGLLAQGLKALDAAIAGVWLHGRAGDLAADSLGQNALIAGDICRNLGQAFLDAHEQSR